MEAKEYREKIIELINKVSGSNTLKYIYEVISAYLKSRGV